MSIHIKEEECIKIFESRIGKTKRIGNRKNLEESFKTAKVT